MLKMKVVLLCTRQGKSFIDKSQIPFGHENIYKWKVMISRVISEHAGEPDKSGKYKIISSIQLLGPGEVCTDSYIIGFPHENKEFVKNYLNYLQTKFVRFLILQALSSINLSRGNYEFVPMEDFSNEITDEFLYEKYKLSDGEIELVESTIKPMDID